MRMHANDTNNTNDANARKPDLLKFIDCGYFYYNIF